MTTRVQPGCPTRAAFARVGLLCLIAATLASAQQPAQQDPSAPTLTVNVKLVNLFVSVTDAHGAPVGGLTKDNFQIFEDGHPEKIAVFERESELPLSIVMAID